MNFSLSREYNMRLYVTFWTVFRFQIKDHYTLSL